MASSNAGVDLHAQKKSPHFWSEGETHLLNIMKDLDINSVLDMNNYCKTDFFKRVVER